MHELANVRNENAVMNDRYGQKAFPFFGVCMATLRVRIYS
jgi:hypothetical protein